MPRDGGPARLRLRQAALELYDQRGFDQVTTAEIAAAADVTERTFYRHFADKREVLFDGETLLRDTLVAGVAEAPRTLAPLSALLWSFQAAIPFVEGSRQQSERLRRVIAATPALRERAQSKAAILTDALAGALQDRGTPQAAALLAAQVGMAVFNHVATVWFRRPEEDLHELLRETFRNLHALTEPLATAA
jgi:AcrR family transcriptional regulator